MQVVAIVGGVGTRQESETDRRAHGISVVDSWLDYVKGSWSKKWVELRFFKFLQVLNLFPVLFKAIVQRPKI